MHNLIYLHALPIWLALAEPEGLAEVEEHTEGLNLLESNVVNILMLVAILVYLVRTIFLKVLAERQAAIATEIEDAESRRQKAIDELAIQQNNLAQAQQEAEKIKQQAELNAAKVRDEILSHIDGDIERLRAAADKDVASESDRITQELRQYLIAQVLIAVEADLPTQLTEERQKRLIDSSLAALAGSL